MRTLAVLGMCVMLAVFFFQCCPTTPAEVRPPGQQLPTSLPTERPLYSLVGSSPENPVPVGHTLVTPYGAAITVQGIRARGEEAGRLAQEWNAFNTPEPGNEYVMLSATVVYEGNDADSLRVSQYDFKVAVGTVIFDHALAVVMEGNELEGEMLPGGRIDGLLIFEVPQGSTGVVLIYEELFEKYYLATE